LKKTILHKVTWRHIAMPITLSLLAQGCQTVTSEQVSPQQMLLEWQGKNWSVPDKIINLDDGIGLKEAEALALFFNPSLRIARLELGLAQTALTHAKLWVDPELGLDGEQILSSVQHPFSFDGGVALTLPLSGLPRFKHKLALAHLSSAESKVLSAEWAMKVQIRKAWLHCDILEQKKRRLESADSELQQIIDLTSAFKAAGKINVVEERSFSLKQMEIHDQLQRLDSEGKEHQQGMWSLIGLPPSSWEREIQSLFTLNDLKQSLPVLNTLAYPVLQQRLNAYEVSERQLALEQRRRFPDLKISLGAGVDEGHSTLSFGLGSFVLPWWNANRQGIAAAKEQRELAKVDIEISMMSFESQKVIMSDQVNHLLERLKTIDERWLPLARQQVIDAKRLAQLGQLNLMLLAEAMEDVRTVESQLDQVIAELSLLHLEWNVLNVEV
jgi:cobalt-zinc-cadmium efflux system outer membrane protein